MRRIGQQGRRNTERRVTWKPEEVTVLCHLWLTELKTEPSTEFGCMVIIRELSTMKGMEAFPDGSLSQERMAGPSEEKSGGLV